jgi:hypothetical protein
MKRFKKFLRDKRKTVMPFGFMLSDRSALRRLLESKKRKAKGQGGFKNSKEFLKYRSRCPESRASSKLEGGLKDAPP